MTEKSFWDKKQGERGQGMTEYIILVSLVAMACLLAVGVFGSNVRNLFVKSSDSLELGEAQDALFETLEQKEIRINDLQGEGSSEGNGSGNAGQGSGDSAPLGLGSSSQGPADWGEDSDLEEEEEEEEEGSDDEEGLDEKGPVSSQSSWYTVSWVRIRRGWGAFWNGWGVIFRRR